MKMKKNCDFTPKHLATLFSLLIKFRSSLFCGFRLTSSLTFSLKPFYEQHTTTCTKIKGIFVKQFGENCFFLYSGLVN